MLAFQQKVFNKCHFFHVNYEDDPRLLLNNPHFMADNINESDVVFIHSNAWSSPDRKDGNVDTTIGIIIIQKE